VSRMITVICNSSCSRRKSCGCSSTRCVNEKRSTVTSTTDTDVRLKRTFNLLMTRLYCASHQSTKALQTVLPVNQCPERGRLVYRDREQRGDEMRRDGHPGDIHSGWTSSFMRVERGRF